MEKSKYEKAGRIYDCLSQFGLLQCFIKCVTGAKKLEVMTSASVYDIRCKVSWSVEEALKVL